MNDGFFVELLTPVQDLVEQAGEMIVREWEREGGPRGAWDKAAIDEEVEWFLRDSLLALQDADFWGEESGQSMTGNPLCWVVDPHDGTSDFLRGLPGSSVSVALLHDGVPVLGVVHAPISPDRGRDCIAWAEGLPHLLRNGQPVENDLSRRHLGKKSLVWLSAAANSKPQSNIQLCQPGRFVAMPSIAYRLARVAAGDGDCAVSLVSLSAHDVAAGHALLRGARGCLLNEQGMEVDYHDMWTVSERCFGGAPRACQALLERPWEEALREVSQLRHSLPISGHFPQVERMQRAAGCLVALLAGDNLGAQVEFMEAEAIAEQHHESPLQMVNGGIWNIIKGQPTDDGELTLSLARSLLHCRDYDHEHCAKQLADWAESHPFDIGMATRLALSAPQRHPHLSCAEACMYSASQHSQANGALMRSAPIGIAAHGDPGKAARWARQHSMLTHPHPVCQEANAVFTAAIAVAIAGASRSEMIETALGVLGHDETSGLIGKTIQKAARGERPEDYQEQMGWVLIALQNAFYHLAAGHDVERSVIETILQGGDTDTNACITGALIGAVEGIQNVPPAWSLAVQSARASKGERARPTDYWPDDAVWLAQGLLV